MEHQSEHAAKFIRELSGLIDRLAAHDIIVDSLHAEYSSFGSWQLIARKHHEEMRFAWDGRDGLLTIEGSPRPDSRAPSEWKEEAAKRFARGAGDDPLAFVESYLIAKFPV